MRHVFDYIRKHKSLLLVIMPAFLVHMLISWPSGSYYCFRNACGMYFWGAHGHDAIWHLAVIAVSFNSFPFIAPTFSGALLTGYNYLIDLIFFVLSKVGISPLFSYFKLFPFIWFIFFTSLTIVLARKIKNSPVYVGLLLFFMFFGGSFSYLITLYHSHTIWGSSGVLTMQAGLTLVNLQFAFSLVFLLGILILILEKNSSNKKTLLLCLLVFVNLGLKFYGGVVSTIIVGSYFILGIKKDKNKLIEGFFRLLILAATVLIAILLFYNPFISLKTGSILSFSPLATVHPIVEDPNLFYLKSQVDARYFLQAQGKISFKLFRIEILELIIFLFFNLGTRFFGLFYIAWQVFKKKFTQIDAILLLGILGSAFLTIFFVQKGQWWNTIQFFYYTLFLANFFTARLLYELFSSKKIIFAVFAVLLCIFTLPTSFDLVKTFAVFPAHSYVSADELKALSFLKSQPSGVVYFAEISPATVPKNESPKPLYSYNDTAYVAAFSAKPVYYADKVQLELTGIDFKSREAKLRRGDCGFFGKIDYVYDVKRKNDTLWKKCSKGETQARKVFENNEVRIYKLH